MAEEGGAKRFVVQIPSAADVELHSNKNSQPLNYFRPSSASDSGPGPAISSAGNLAGPALNSQPEKGRAATSFAETFSFLRNTEFYSPPPARPPAPAPAPPSAPPPTASGAIPSSVAGKPKTEGSYAAAAQTAQARNAILVSRRQQGNSVLKHIRNARWMFADIVPDYILGQNSCALYLSLRYHLLHPDYIYFRIRELQKNFRLRIVLCHVDVDDVIKPLHEVTKTCLLHDCSLLCAWSQEECARYLETIKIYENKPASDIQERTDSDYVSRLTSSLTTVRHVNKTDVLTLGSSFQTLSAIFNSSMDDLARCPGIGERKVKRLYDAFNEPFKRASTSKLPRHSSQDKPAPDAADDGGKGQGKAGPSSDDAGPGESTGKKAATKSKEAAAPVSKLIDRKGEVSIRDALDVARAKTRKRSASKLETPVADASVSGGVEIVDLESADNTFTNPAARASPEPLSDEYVISLDD